MAHMAGTYPSFCSMKQLRVLLLPPGWDASPLQGYPQQYDASPHFIHLGEERQTGLKFLVLVNTTMAGTGPRATFVGEGGDFA